MYAPHSGRADVEIENFYEDLTHALNTDKAKHTIVMGDFNAKIGAHTSGEQYIGQYGLGQRNKRGVRLVDFASSNQLYVANTFFNKKPSRKWTWLSPDNKTKNEIDYFLTSQKRLTQDVSVLNLSFGSDHRIVRAKIHIPSRGARVHSTNRVPTLKIQPNLLKIPEKRQQYISLVNAATLVTREPDLDIESLNNKLTSSILNAAQKSIAPNKRPSRSSRPRLDS